MSPLTLPLVLLSLGGCFSSVDWTLLVTPEVCDGVDNDEDDRIDEGLPQYADVDGDGFGDPQNVLGCEAESGAVVDGTDCDDGDAAVHPGAEERCDRLDDDCDRSADEGLAQYADVDGDGFGDPANILGCEGGAGEVVVDGSDCDDGNADVYPDADELCDKVDNDCDKGVDEGLPLTTYYADVDGDGFGDSSTPIDECVAPSGLITDNNDCDDGDASVYPGAQETCGDGVISDCEMSPAEARADCSVGEMDLGAADAMFTGEYFNDRAGADVSSAGDLNGDDIVDIFVSTTANRRTGATLGAVFGVYGPFSGERSLSTAEVVLVGEATNDSFGVSIVGSVDINQDDAPDLMVGAYRNDRGGDDSGAAYVFYGPISGEVSADNADVIFVGESADDNAGVAIAWVGDTNGGHGGDILIGAASNDRGGSEAGTAYLFTSEVLGAVSLGSADCIIMGNTINDGSAESLSGVADTNGDGLMDILIGTHGDDAGGTDAGSASLFLGPLNGELRNSDADASLVGEAAGDESGWEVRAAGDSNSDGYADVLVAGLNNDRGGTNAGAVYLLNGPLIDQSLASADAFFVGEAAEDILMMESKTPQDLNGDGSPDLVLASLANDRGGAESGTTYIFLTPVTGVHSVADADVLLTGEAAGDYSGNSLAALPDQDGDGLGELLIGAIGSDRAFSSAGAAYLILGKTLWNY